MALPRQITSGQARCFGMVMHTQAYHDTLYMHLQQAWHVAGQIVVAFDAVGLEVICIIGTGACGGGSCSLSSSTNNPLLNNMF